MRATFICGPGDIRVETAPDPVLRRPTDAIVKVVAACVCGTDLWQYRGIEPIDAPPHPIGHEFVGTVEEVGPDVHHIRAGDFVVAPFAISDGTCPNCLNGMHASCRAGGWWGTPDREGLPVDGCQGERVRVPLADGTLVATPAPPDLELVPSLLALSDVMGTGHHAAVSGRVGPGSTVAVIGDGAVGLCAVLASRRLGAERVIAMSRHTDRQAIACEFGATDIVPERGAEGAAAVREMLGGTGADAALECVGTKQSMQQAFGCVRPGGFVGYVGVPAGGPEFPIDLMFTHNLNVAGGTAPVRAYLPELLDEVLTGGIRPGRVFDLELPLEQAAEAYEAMDTRRAIKVLLRP